VEPITITQTTTIRAIATKHGFRASEVVSATYILNKVANPTFSLPAGVHFSDEMLTISTATQNAEIYYSINHIDPYQHPAFLYTDPISLPLPDAHEIVVKARAYRANWTPSDMVTIRYVFNNPRMLLVSTGNLRVSQSYFVSLDGFLISNYLVTQAEWQDIMGGNTNGISSTPSHFADNDAYPVEFVSWYDAIVYCNRRSIRENLSPVYARAGNTNPDTWGPSPTTLDASWNAITMDITRNGYRLPTEMEWMFAANGGKELLGFTYSGSNDVDDVAWYLQNAGGKTHPVGQKQGNELGLFDMSGNVWEWVWDWHHHSYPTGTATNPTGPSMGEPFKIQRGGSFLHDESRSTITFRGRNNPNHRAMDNGFRVVRSE
jgi:formylglycine-generating enzyme required for sulfatase activity